MYWFIRMCHEADLIAKNFRGPMGLARYEVSESIEYASSLLKEEKCLTGKQTVSMESCLDRIFTGLSPNQGLRPFQFFSRQGWIQGSTVIDSIVPTISVTRIHNGPELQHNVSVLISQWDGNVWKFILQRNSNSGSNPWSTYPANANFVRSVPRH